MSNLILTDELPFRRTAMRWIMMSLMCLPTWVVAAPKVEISKLPAGALQPQVAVDSVGGVHVIYFKGQPSGGDLYYIRRKSGEDSKAIRVNERPGSAMAIGTIRGAHLAVGKGGRVHVAWMGAKKTEGPSGRHPMWYARLSDDGRSFESERDLLDRTSGLDGGGSIAADGSGKVFVVWHGTAKGVKPQAGEKYRAVWVRTSVDGGKTFGPEIRADRTKPLGTCGCCGLKARANADQLVILYRAAEKTSQRDMRLLVSTDGKAFVSRPIDRWMIKSCPMSSADALAMGKQWVLAWESRRQVYLGILSASGKKSVQALRGPLQANCKHPSLAVSKEGYLLMVWAEGTGWKRGGSIAWRVFDPKGKPVAGADGRAKGLPAWSRPAAHVSKDGHFRILY
jgi:hypothetical protein